MPRIHKLPARHPHRAKALSEAAQHLAAADERMSELIRRIGPCDLRREGSGFAQVFRAILSQQLSGKAASTIRGRIVTACGGRVTPEAVLALPDSAFREAGVSRPKTRYLRALAETVRSDPRFFERLRKLSDEAALERLTSLLGVGRWTAEMYLIFSLGRLDVLPLGDVSILSASANLHGIPRSRILRRLPRIAESWRPYRSVAVWYLYAHLDSIRPRR
ncbi:MAG TPA: DNA-3-methyladenine glycosylase 2 family protein [Stellaceae bacterium]|nr:DNA-3-methyladenine glycosylase 2 family protein [Stellaceae bacterium]